MSGHSKWASIKHKKAATDAKRGQMFTKLIKELTVAARDGGGDPSKNPGLRVAMSRAKEANMPTNNIDRAIKKGTGELPGVTYETAIYEGYGSGGVAMLVETVTDNKNRTSAEIRNIFSKKGGNLAGAGSVAWMFQKRGFIVVNKSAIDEDELMSIVLDAGAEDLKTAENNYEITSGISDFEKVKEALKVKDIKSESAEITMIPKSTVKVTGEAAKNILAFVEALEEHEDVQNVYANFDIPDDVLEKMAQG